MRLEMKVLKIGMLAAALGLGLAAAEDPSSRHISATSSYPPGCTAAINGAPGYLPRAGLALENRTGRTVRAWLEPRHGLPQVDLGTIGGGETRLLAHALPAGRNLLHATAAQGPPFRIVLPVANHGAGTCNRRYLWRIE